MGQQQLLLIVLGVIIVGIAVVVGINVFTASSLQANNNAVIADLQTIGSMAQQWYRKPTAMGGGGNSFGVANGATAAWAVPAALSQTANMSNDVVIGGGGDQDITLTATGTEENDGGALIVVVMNVTPTEVTVTSTTVND